MKILQKAAIGAAVFILAIVGGLCYSASRVQAEAVNPETFLRKPMNWHRSSEKRPYPKLDTVQDFWVHVSINKNRTYLMDGQRVIYVMYSAAGRFGRRDTHGHHISDTPTGVFHIQKERGKHFFNPSINCGANYYVSFHDHGKDNFHSPEVDQAGHYLPGLANRIGNRRATWGCVSLTIPDSIWFYQHVPRGTKVVITKN